MYIYGDGSRKTDEENYESSSYWCLQSMKNFGPDDDMEARRADIAEAVAAVDRGRGVIVLTDLFGGTPSNLAISLMEPGRVEVIAGVNLPMLIRLESARKMGKVQAAVAAARDAGRKYISVASEVLGAAAA